MVISRKASKRAFYISMTEKIKDIFISLVALVRKPASLYPKLLRGGLELLRKENGAFVAASGEDYSACWIRDQVYATYAFYYLDDIRKFSEGLHVVFDILTKARPKIESALCRKPVQSADYLHAKYHAEMLCEVTDDWGHHQVDAIGLFLFVVARAERKGVRIIRHEADREMLQLLVSYLAAVRYFEEPDNGMWEEGMELHASSIGAAVAGLREIAFMKLAVVPGQLILRGEEMLSRILPRETFSRNVDMAQLSLLWPYRVVSKEMADTVLERVKETLVQKHGLNRYLGDNYYRSHNGISGEWPMGFFWLAIIYADRKEYLDARYWFERGMATITETGHLPELHQNGMPNDHTPLAWAHSLALIAATKLEGQETG